jgi:hypothetical protein
MWLSSKESVGPAEGAGTLVGGEKGGGGTLVAEFTSWSPFFSWTGERNAREALFLGIPTLASTSSDEAQKLFGEKLTVQFLFLKTESTKVASGPISK